MRMRVIPVLLGKSFTLVYIPPLLCKKIFTKERLQCPAKHPSIPAVLPLASRRVAQAADEAASEGGELETVYVTAQRQLQQSLGVSKITAKDLETRPAVNDISDIVRTMPGVNLTGNTASGERGNKRQIDIRGMGPENTLILIDGPPRYLAQRRALQLARRAQHARRQQLGAG